MANDIGVCEHRETIWFSDKICFDFHGDKGLQIEEIISHLEGLRKISKNVPGLLDNLLKETILKQGSAHLQFSEVNITKLETGSLDDWLNLGMDLIIMGEVDEETKKKVVEDIKKMSTTLKVASIIGCLATGWVLKSVISPSDKTTIENHGILVQQTLGLNIGNQLGIPAEKVVETIKKATEKPHPYEIQAAIDFVRPAKKHGGNIKFPSGEDGVSSYDIPDNVVKAMPDSYTRPDKTTMEEEKNNVTLDLRAVDRDNPAKGWKVIIPEVIPDQKLKLEIGPDVDLAKLSSFRAKGDIVVTYEVKPDLTKKISHVLLVRLVI